MCLCVFVSAALSSSLVFFISFLCKLPGFEQHYIDKGLLRFASNQMYSYTVQREECQTGNIILCKCPDSSNP